MNNNINLLKLPGNIINLIINKNDLYNNINFCFTTKKLFYKEIKPKNFYCFRQLQTIIKNIKILKTNINISKSYNSYYEYIYFIDFFIINKLNTRVELEHKDDLIGYKQLDLLFLW